MKNIRKPLQGRRIRAFHFVALGVVIFLSAGCTYPVRNLPTEAKLTKPGYEWARPLPSTGNTLVVVTISGGGSRATALGLSVLEALNQIELPDGTRLARHIDILSSVSGGSVAAAYFALEGPEGVGKLRPDFLDKDVMGAILARGVNPVSLAQLSTNGMERIDLLIDYFDRSLFGGRTYQDLLTRKDGPYLVLNAADMVSGTPFALTQNNFELICSDLTKLKLSTAVAASAAFPLALSPVTLTNYCRTPDQMVLPSYVISDVGTQWGDNPSRSKRGRVRQGYKLGATAKPSTAHVHLLDGGIADNLALAEPLDILTRNAPWPNYLDALARGHIQNIVFVMVNARSFSASDLGKKRDTPGIVDMLLATINSSIDNQMTGASARLRSVLTEKFTEDAALLQKAGDSVGAARLLALKDRTNLIEVDFDAIEDPDCRQRFHSIPTSWTLKKVQVDALMVMGGALLRASKPYGAALAALNATDKGASPQLREACNLLPAIKP